MLGADMRISMTRQLRNDAEYAFLSNQGKISESIWMRSMVRQVDGDHQALAEIKAVDHNYPLYGTFKTAPEGDFSALFGKRNGRYGVVVSQLLLDRLELKTGDTVNIGDLTFIIRAITIEESDLLSEGFLLGQRIFMAKEAMTETGLLQPGSLFSYTYKLKIPDITDDSLKMLQEKTRKTFPDAGWTIRTRLNAAPILAENLGRFS